VRPPDTETEWSKRIARAGELAVSRPASAEALRFYEALARIQFTLPKECPDGVNETASSFALRLNAAAVARLLPEFVRQLAPHAPAALARDLKSIHADEAGVWRDWLTQYWSSGGRDAGEWPAARAFAAEALLQPFAARIAARATPQVSPDASSWCPLCTGPPLVAVLRDEAHSARRSLVCGLCQTEFPALRIQCIQCGETQFDSLPVFRADELASVRLDACDTCHRYVKTIDLTRDGDAIPIVDDIGTFTLDLWAREQGYRRIRPNVLRI
jgi:FdhE protein